MSEFEFPKVYIGCPVEISSDPSESDKSLGWVFEALPDSCSVVTVAGTQLYNCWHADDPRCVSMPDQFQQEELHRGVFRLTEGEIQRRQSFRRMADLEGRLGELFVRLHELSRTVEELRPDVNKQKTAKRRPGRVSRQEALVSR